MLIFVWEVTKMTRSKQLLSAVLGLLLSLALVLQTDLTVCAAGTGDLVEVDLRGGVAAVLNPGQGNSSEVVEATARALNLDIWSEQKEEENSTLVMANVQSALNVRSEAGEEAR